MQHKLSRQASPSRFTTSAQAKNQICLRRLQRTDIDYKTKRQGSILKIKIFQQHGKTHFKCAGLRLLSTSCKAFRANQVNRWRAMLGSKICLTWRATPDFYTTHSFRILPPIDLQPDCRSLTSLCEAYIPKYQISMSEEQADGFKPLR